MFLRALAATAALLVVSCGSIPTPNIISPYRIEIQQGNFVSQEMVSQLKSGMSKDQVRFIMGTPLITDSFHGNRWDYVFRRQRANSRELEQRAITVIFEEGKLKRVEGDVAPAARADAGGPKTLQGSPATAVATPSAPTAQAASGASQPPATATSDQPAAAPSPSTEGKPQEKNWWENLKETLSR